MMTWQHSAPSNLTIQTHQTNLSLDEASPSNLLGLQVGKILEYQEEYPQEVAEEVAEEAEEEAEEEDSSLLQHPYHKELLTQETNLLAIHPSYSQGTEQSRKHS